MATSIKEREQERSEQRARAERAAAYTGPPETAGYSSGALITMGIVEIIFGLTALALPVATSALLIALLGGILVVSGVIEFFSSFARRSWGRFFYGVLAIAAGALVIAHPVFNLAFLTLLVSLFFIAAGAAQLASYAESGWVIASGIVNLILGAILLFNLPAASLVAIAILIGINVLFAGIATLSLGVVRRNPARTA